MALFHVFLFWFSVRLGSIIIGFMTAICCFSDPSTLIRNSIVYFSCLIISSISLMWGAIQVQLKFMYPFIAFYVFYIAILALQLSVFIMSLKSNESGLGDMILYSNLGSFVLLFYLYTLAIVVSFIQIIKDLRKRLEKKPLLVKEAQKKINTIHDSYNMKENYFQYVKSFTK
ncbi:uncharacterized protein LOC123314111 [Coccinella septempunctata]|uniref:uncharacterized protein LOC123314111 n=1 Tax=Coccinella septempunctata TaxID=41139 RepID=UPI001D07C43E|nr:uncharacterized protein LOC123314111 [Coccinella septempunctata]